MKQKKKQIWSRAAPILAAGGRRALALAQGGTRVIGLYLDDLLLVGGGVCFTRAAWEALGRPGALVVGGISMVVYAMVIAKARRGGGH